MFTLTPTEQNFDLKPGNIYSGKVTVTNSNNAEGDFAYKISVAPYSVIGEEYHIDLATVSNYSMIADWITIDAPVGNLKPGETKDINFTIEVPESAPAGGQYASILVTEDTDPYNSQGFSVNSVFEVASLIYASVSGEIKRSGEIKENNIPSFATSTPVSTNVLVTNGGNVHESVITLIKVKNLLNGETILKGEQSSGRHYDVIMPETARRIEYDIDNLPVVGVVEINQTIYYNGETSVETKNLIICPVWFMTLVVLAIGLIIWTIVTKFKKHKRRKSII